MPDYWKTARAQGLSVNEDYFQAVAFANAIQGKAPNPIGIHEAMDMTLPGLASQLSIADGGRWIDVPDSRNW